MVAGSMRRVRHTGRELAAAAMAATASSAAPNETGSEGRTPVERRSDQPAEQNAQQHACRRTGQHDACEIPQQKGGDAAALRPDGDADAEFAGALRGVVGEQAVRRGLRSTQEAAAGRRMARPGRPARCHAAAGEPSAADSSSAVVSRRVRLGPRTMRTARVQQEAQRRRVRRRAAARW